MPFCLLPNPVCVWPVFAWPRISLGRGPAFSRWRCGGLFRGGRTLGFLWRLGLVRLERRLGRPVVGPFDLGQQLVLLNGSVSLINALGQSEGQTQGGHAHHNRSQHQHVRQRIGILLDFLVLQGDRTMMSLRFLPTLLRMMVNFTVRIVFRLVDRNGRFLLHRNGNVKENDRCLKTDMPINFLIRFRLEIMACRPISRRTT